jgi:hypothetical protein
MFPVNDVACLYFYVGLWLKSRFKKKNLIVLFNIKNMYMIKNIMRWIFIYKINKNYVFINKKIYYFSFYKIKIKNIIICMVM